MTGRTGREVANQFIITEKGGGENDGFVTRQTFQSYNSIIAVWTVFQDGVHKIELDNKYWDYSTTTGKYRNQFLGEDKATTLKKIESGEYVLTNLN